MRFANPAGLFLLLLAVPIVVLHILRPRRERFEVSSTYLWRELAQPVSAARPWQRLRPSLLLFLQLAAVILLAFAVARPVRPTQTPLAEHTVFIIDASGSMAAKDGDPDRVADAKRAAADLRDQLPSGGVASIVVASDHPRVALTASPDPDAFAAALAPIETTAGSADWSTAFLLAESLETPGLEIGFQIVSDGGLSDAEQRLIPPGSDYVKVGDRSTNRGISRLTVEPRGSGLHARAAVINTGGEDATQTVRFDVDGVTQAERSVTIPEGETVEVGVDLPDGDRIEAFLEGEDLLDADDHAYAVAARQRVLTVLLAGPADPFLETLLGAIPGVTVERSDTADPAPDADVAIYDRVDPPADPEAPFLAIAPPGGAPGAGVAVTGAVERPAIALVRPDDPVTQDLDLTGVAIATAQRLDAPGATPLVAAEGTPLLLRGSLNGLPFAYLGFGLTDSNLPVQVAFPILFDRLLTDLAGAALPPEGLVVGSPLPVDPDVTAIVTAPGRTRIEVVPGAPVPVAHRPGFWTIATDGRPERIIAINADPGESHLRPAQSLLTPARQQRPGDERPVGEVPLLVWVALPLLVLLAAEWLAARRRVGVSRRQWRVATVVRVVIALLLVGALLDLALARPGNRVATMFLVDGSDSLGAGGRSEAVDWVRQSLDEQPDGAVAGVAVFGGDARLELTVQEKADLTRPAAQVDTTRTNLATALRLAGAVLPADARRRIVVVSDGRATTGDALAEAQRLAEEGTHVEFHVVGQQAGADVAVAAVDAPTRVREGEAFDLNITLSSTRAGPTQLTVFRDGEVVHEAVVDLDPGTTTVVVPQTAGGSGLTRYQVRVSGAGDTVLQNDVGYAAVEVEGPARVLLLEGAQGNASTLADALRAGGLTVDVAPAAALPPLDRLATYDGAVLVDVDERQLTDEQVRTMAAYTRDAGRGLVSLGGHHSYGLGGYFGSELEQLLPVVSEILDPQRRQTVAQVLAIDSSGSMGECHCAEGGRPSARLPGGVEKVDIARAGSARAIDALSENDEVGVLAFSTQYEWLIDLQQLPSEEVVDEGLGRLVPAGGTDLSRSLALAADDLRQSHAALKHIIVFTDGFTSEAVLDDLVDEAAGLRVEGITVSVIATGEGAADQLEEIAEAGGGRFYPGRDLQEIPQLIMEETILASRDFITEGQFLPIVTSSAPVVRDLTESPPLLGYVATTAKGEAQVLLRIGPDQDPLLASWQVGLGRVTSWTSDASQQWSQLWSTWDGYVDFWNRVVKDTFGAASSIGVRARIEDGTLRVTVDQEGPFADGATATARIADPSLDDQEIRLERTGANTFEGEASVTEAGTYAVGVSVRAPDGQTLLGSTLATQSYAPEYEPGVPDEQALTQLSDATEGRGAISPAQAFDAGGLRPGRARIPLAGWFLLTAALLFPIAVAVSRLALRGAVVVAVRRRAAWVRWAARSAVARAPALPGRERGPGPAKSPAPPERPVPERVRERERKVAAAAAQQTATVGRLLERKRELHGDGQASPDSDGG
ncbi:MAG: VWA domain-containing protein [Acidimicrobiales bacterium]